MTDKEKVLAKWPRAFAWMYAVGDWLISSGESREELGSGPTESEAWADAAKELE